jgi:hypothetical protein
MPIRILADCIETDPPGDRLTVVCKLDERGFIHGAFPIRGTLLFDDELYQFDMDADGLLQFPQDPDDEWETNLLEIKIVIGGRFEVSEVVEGLAPDNYQIILTEQIAIP